jgi:hypothetical protein
MIFLSASIGTLSMAAELTLRLSKVPQGGTAMGHQPASWRTAHGQTAWLSMLIEAMERLSRPEWRARPIDRLELAAVRARLARPAAAVFSGPAFRRGRPN